jgi:hypothetical protein
VGLLDSLREELAAFFGKSFIPNLFIEILHFLMQSKAATSTEVFFFAHFIGRGDAKK